MARPSLRGTDGCSGARSIPGFLDVAANLNAPEMREDNVISRAMDAGRDVVMFGDETWLRLFPTGTIPGSCSVYSGSPIWWSRASSRFNFDVFLQHTKSARRKRVNPCKA